MKKKFTAVMIMSFCIVMLCASSLLGCTPGNVSQNSPEQQQNRAYMSQVNEIVLEANGNLDVFVDAVSNGDIVNIKTAANNAVKTLSKLSALEAPEALKDIQEDYKAGSEMLSDALTQYVDLYANSTSGDAVGAVSSEEVARIQELYNEGVAHLKAGDEAAAEL